MWNMTGYKDVTKLNDIKNQWEVNDIPTEVLNEIQSLVKYNIQSRSQEDQYDQKRLYMKLHELCLGYKKVRAMQLG